MATLPATDLRARELGRDDLTPYEGRLREAFTRDGGREAQFPGVLDTYVQGLRAETLRSGEESLAWQRAATLMSGEADLPWLADDFAEFVRDRRRIAGTEPFTIDDFWAQFRRDFAAYHGSLNGLQMVAGQMLLNADESHPTGVECESLRYATEQALLWAKTMEVYLDCQEVGQQEVVEVRLASSVAYAAGLFHGSAVLPIAEDLSQPEPTGAARGLLGAYRRLLPNYLNPHFALGSLKARRASALRRTEIVISDSVRTINAEKPAALIALMLEFVRVVGVAATRHSNRISFTHHDTGLHVNGGAPLVAAMNDAVLMQQIGGSIALLGASPPDWTWVSSGQGVMGITVPMVPLIVVP